MTVLFEQDPSSGACFQRVDLGETLGGLPAVCERLPNLPAVYAFVRRIGPPPVHDPAAFVAAVRAAVESKAAPDHLASIGPLHKAILQSFSGLSAAKNDSLERLASSPEFRNAVRDMFLQAAPLQAPLYVGKARGLQERFAQHIKPMSALNRRLRRRVSAWRNAF